MPNTRERLSTPHNSPAFGASSVHSVEGFVVEPEDLFQRVYSGILEERLPAIGASEWTYAVKRILRAIGKKADSEIVVYPNDTDGEFLLDLIWLKPARHDVNANGRIVLAVESEWDCRSDEVWCDYSKLLYVRAARKLMICCVSQKALPAMLRQFEQDLVDVGGIESNEKYILFNFGNQQAECWWCETSNPIKFQQGPRRTWPVDAFTSS